ncbi:MAG: hypothetical protein ACREXU_20370 [Gammaproteobacteria bacterium]
MSKRSKRLMSLLLGAGLVLIAPEALAWSWNQHQPRPYNGFESYSPGYSGYGYRPAYPSYRRAYRPYAYGYGYRPQYRRPGYGSYRYFPGYRYYPGCRY